MPIKVCHITSVHDRHDKRIIKMCNSLATAGYEVTLLCADNAPDSIRDNLKIVSVKFHPKNRVQRIVSSRKVMLQAALEIDADIYHFHDPELIPVGLQLKKNRKAIIYDSHEEYSLNILYKTWIPRLIRPLIGSIFRYYENNAVRLFDSVISVTPQIVNKFAKLNRHATLVTNYPLINSYLSEKRNAKNKIIKAEKKICYAGVIEPGRMHHIIVNAIERVPEAGYLLAGTGNKNYMAKLKKLPMWKNVTYLGELSFDEVLLMYERSVAGIVVENYGMLNYGKEGSLGVTKLFEYMSVGLPVICTDFVLYREIIAYYRCGICVNPDDIDSIAKAISYILKHPAEARQMGENGKRAVLEKYNWGTQEKVLLDMYEKISN